jgi:PAS domain S-box-containing protein
MAADKRGDRSRAGARPNHRDDLFRLLAETAVEAVLSVDGSGRIVFANRAAEHLFGYTDGELSGQDLSLLISLPLAKRCGQDLADYLAVATRQGTELGGRHRNGRPCTLTISFGELCRDGERLFTGFVRQSGRRRQLEERLRACTESFRHLIDWAPIAIVTLDRELKVTRWNASAERLFGWSEAEILNRPLPFLPAEKGEEFQALLSAYRSGPVVDFATYRLRKDGSKVQVSISANAARDRAGEIVELHGFFVDISERWRAAQELRKSHDQLRALSARLLSIREEERTRIARELHDELGQCLIGLKLQLAALGVHPPRDPQRLRRKVEALTGLIDQTLDTVSRLSTELRPAILDRLGLTAGIEWQVAEFAERTGIRCDLAAKAPDARVSSAVSTAVFRILQEALTNVAKHSRARHVMVRLAEESGRLVLEVDDDGVGMNDRTGAADLKLGLVGIRERTAALGGSAAVGGAPGMGTSVRVEIPTAAEPQ